jgi:anti-sigma-K factor RskA
MSRDHEQYEENVGAYLLGALTELEAEVFERHVASCASCRQDFEHMRVASEALPRAVEPVVPPASLKKSLMETVNAEARERERVARSRTWRDRLRLPQLRPAFALGMAAVLAVGVAIGIGVAGIGGSSSKTVAAVVDHGRLPMANASLVVSGDSSKGGVLKLDGMPQPGTNQVYEVWVHRDGQFVPAGALFGVSKDGSGSAAIATDLKGVDTVAVTREPQGGTQQPTETPVMTFKLA